MQVRPLPEAFAVERDDGGTEELIARLRDMVGGALVAAGLPLAVVNPRRIREFAKAVGKLGKTDRLEAWAFSPRA